MNRPKVDRREVSTSNSAISRPLPNNGLFQNVGNQTRASASKRSQQVVEISDDDSDDIPRMVKHQMAPRRPGTPIPGHSQKGAWSGEPELLSDSDSSLDLLIRSRHNVPPMKRAKLQHETSAVSLDQFKLKGRAREHSPSPQNWAKSSIKGPKSVIDRSRLLPVKNEPPYFDDEHLGIRLYRGPGFEDFPIAVGTLDGLQELCDKWDRKTAARGQDVKTLPQQSKFTQAQDRCLAGTLLVLPDIDHEFVRQHFSLTAEQNPQLPPDQLSIDLIVSGILEKTEKTGYPAAPKEAVKDNGPEPAADGTGVTIPVRDDLRHRHTYRKEAVIILAWIFDHIPTCTISKVLDEQKTIFDSYLKLADMDDTYFDITRPDKPYRRRKDPRRGIEKKYVVYERRDDAVYPWWVNEVQAAKQHREREAIKTNRKVKEEIQEAKNLEEQRQTGALIECGICFDDEVPMNRAITCEGDNAHFFCYSCVRQLAEHQIGLMKHEMVCQDSDDKSGKCTAALDRDGIGRAVGIKILDRLALNEQTAEINKAELEGLEQCPYCDFKAILDPVETATVFQCCNPECGRASCRKCHEDAHVPMTCEEIRKDRGLSARHQVEEARSESVMRACPKCKVKIVKDHGCNKMQCVQCNTLMCYICKVDITVVGYNHFHDARGNKQGKCPLYDNNTANMHEEEANAAERETIKKVTAEDADIDEAALRIETGRSNAGPANGLLQNVRHFLVNGHPQNLNPQQRAHGLQAIEYEVQQQQRIRHQAQHMRDQAQHMGNQARYGFAPQLQNAAQFGAARNVHLGGLPNAAPVALPAAVAQNAPQQNNFGGFNAQAMRVVDDQNWGLFPQGWNFLDGAWDRLFPGAQPDPGPVNAELIHPPRARVGHYHRPAGGSRTAAAAVPPQPLNANNLHRLANEHIRQDQINGNWDRIQQLVFGRR